MNITMEGEMQRKEQEELEKRFKELRDSILSKEHELNPNNETEWIEINGKKYLLSKTALDKFYGK